MSAKEQAPASEKPSAKQATPAHDPLAPAAAEHPERAFAPPGAAPAALNPQQIAGLQRTVGNQAIAHLLGGAARRELLAKPSLPPPAEALPNDHAPTAREPSGQPVAQRHIVGASGKNIWADEIAGRVHAEKNDEIKQAATRLHSISQPIFVASYEDLVENIRAGAYSDLLGASQQESPKEAKYESPTHPAIAIIGLLSDNYGAALGGHPLAAQVLAGTWDGAAKPAWRTKGIREVLNMFLHFYTNADTLDAYFTQHADQRTLSMMKTLNSFFKAKLGALMGGDQELNELAGGQKTFGVWFKEGLDAIEAKLAQYAADSEKLDSYITFNLDNDTKAYFRKLGEAKNQARDKNAPPRSAEEIMLQLSQRISNKPNYLDQIYLYMKDLSAPLNAPTMLHYIEEIWIYMAKDPSIKPDEHDVTGFLAQKQNVVKADLTVSMATISGSYLLVGPNGTIEIPRSDTIAWLQKTADHVNKVQIVAKSDNKRYVLIGKNNMNFLFNELK